MKKCLCLCLAVVLMLCVSGCRFFGNDFSSLLVAPESPGELNEIQNVLVESINGEYTLQYPAEGAYRSAMVQYDLNGDGKVDVLDAKLLLQVANGTAKALEEDASLYDFDADGANGGVSRR